ncbi:MAG: hemolysin III family protein [Ktedonobacterales bacterium]|nr:hemolysin III family protein [Ktedonobacterales bacterium]
MSKVLAWNRGESEATLSKPLLRGYFHAGAAVTMVAGTAVLLAVGGADRPKQLTFLIYGSSCLLLFGVSALYHTITWDAPRRALLQRLDHANIFILIAGTYTPIAFNVMTGGWRVGILAAVWGLALVGVLVVAPARRLPRWLSVGLYIATGWVALAASPEIVRQLGLGALLTLVLGGILYTAGALAYALKRPALWPRVFGYHELFHIGTIAANAVFFTFMLVYVLPFARR